MKYVDYSFKTSLGIGYYVKKSIKWIGIFVASFIVLFLTLIVSLKWVNPPVTSFTLQENWEELGASRYSLTEYWVDYQNIPESLKWAVVAAEDQKFWEHDGIDLEAIQEAWQEMEEGERVRGASTITQQVVKNLFLTGNKTFVRKGIEATLAVVVDAVWGKERTLEIYLNIAEFGPGIYGVGKSSEHFFGKSVLELKDEESARMAAVLPNPKRMRVEPATPYVEKRKYWILKNMRNLSGISYYSPQKSNESEEKTDSTVTFSNSFIEKVDISNWTFQVSADSDSTQ